MRYDVPLAPNVVLDRLKDATVPFGIFREALQTPVESTIELYRQSLIGPKKLMMKIDSNGFHLMNIGLMWPLNTPAATFRLGVVEGTVRESADGSTIRARYKPLVLSLFALCGIVFAAVVFTSVSIFLFANGLDGGAIFLGASGCWDVMVAAVFLHAYVGGRAEAKFIKKCLDELVECMMVESAPLSSDQAD